MIFKDTHRNFLLWKKEEILINYYMSEGTGLHDEGPLKIFFSFINSTDIYLLSTSAGLCTYQLTFYRLVDKIIQKLKV